MTVIGDLIFCYQDKKGDILVFPLGTPPRGPQTVINRPQALVATIPNDELGAAIRRARQWCDYRLDDPSGPLPQLAATGEKSYSQFAKKRHLVSVNFADVIELTPAKKDGKGAYWFNVDLKVGVPAQISDSDLGQSLRNAFRQCLDG